VQSNHRDDSYNRFKSLDHPDQKTQETATVQKPSATCNLEIRNCKIENKPTNYVFDKKSELDCVSLAHLENIGKLKQITIDKKFPDDTLSDGTHVKIYGTIDLDIELGAMTYSNKFCVVHGLSKYHLILGLPSLKYGSIIKAFDNTN